MQNNKHFKVLTYLGYSLLAIMLFNAVFFANERIYGDAAGYLVNMINASSFNIEHARPASIFIEWLPVALIKLKYSLDIVLIGFSLCEWLFIFLSFILLSKVLKDIQSALAMLFTFLLGSRYNYFNPVSELILATPLLFIFYSLLKNKPLRGIYLLLQLFLITFLIFSHPLYSIVILIILGWLWMDEKYRSEKYALPLIVLSFAIIVIHYFLLDQYERNPLKELNGTGLSSYQRIIHFGFYRFFITMIPIYAGTLTFLFLSIKQLYQQKKQKQLYYFLITIILFEGLIFYKYNYLFPNTIEPFERYHFPIVMLVCFVFFGLFPVGKLKYIGLIALLSVYQFIWFYNYGFFVKDRFRQLTRAIEYSKAIPESKIVFKAKNYYARPLGGDWIMSNESMILSSLNNNSSTKQIMMYEYFAPGQLESIPEDHYLSSPAPVWPKPIRQLNRNYFNMNNSKLFFANTDAAQDTFPDDFFKNISITIGNLNTNKRNKQTYIPITIYNKNCDALTSGLKSDGVYLSYHWLKLTGETVVWDGLRTPLMADVHQQLSQEINIANPSSQGLYRLVVDIVYEGKRWCNINGNKELNIN